MSHKKLPPLVLAAAFFTLLILISLSFLPPFIKNNGQIRLQVGKAEFGVEIANDSASRAKGLSGRQSLGESEGMLFIFEKPDFYSFWIKRMKFPLDIIWISDGRVVEISENLPPATIANLATYSPRQPVNMVLEINAGTARDKGVAIGDPIELLDGNARILYY